MVASISFSARECRHADEIFAFPARTEFSVTTGQEAQEVSSDWQPCHGSVTNPNGNSQLKGARRAKMPKRVPLTGLRKTVRKEILKFGLGSWV